MELTGNDTIYSRNLYTPSGNSKIYCDGGHNKDTGEEAWGSTVNSDSKDLLSDNLDLLKDISTKEVKLPGGIRTICVSKFNDVKSQQNNGAELLALVCALRITDKDKNINEICCDSELLVKWWSKGHINSKTRKTMDKDKIKYIEECTKLRTEFEKRGGKITKISGNDNLADLGYHK